MSGVTTFTVSELLRLNQQGERKKGGPGWVSTPLLSRLKLIRFLVPGILSRSRK